MLASNPKAGDAYSPEEVKAMEESAVELQASEQAIVDDINNNTKHQIHPNAIFNLLAVHRQRILEEMERQPPETRYDSLRSGAVWLKELHKLGWALVKVENVK